MSEQIPPQNDINEELRRLGENINLFVKTAWESPERQKIQKELETHLNELGKNLEQAANNFSTSPTGQQIKNDIDDFGQRVSNGELEQKIKKEVANVLSQINQHIEQASNRPPNPPPGTDTPPKA